MTLPPTLDLTTLRAAYRAGDFKPAQLIHALYRRIREDGDPAVWIHLIPEARALAQAETVDQSLPLAGIPFAVKDNIDVAGVPTTAGCPEFAYTPEETSPVVQRLLDAGAILLGKTNLDQFATGLVGTRSPYGAPGCVFDAAFIPGGSSSGSAVAVASSLVTFALGTDTAGSGRVPAAFNNILGHKPTRGLLSTRGVVPACRTLDCVSIFALTPHDALEVFSLAQGFDERDPFSRRAEPQSLRGPALRLGVPAPEQLEFFGDTGAALLFERAVDHLPHCGWTKVEIDFTPFREAAALLYSGPWVAERLAAIEALMNANPEALHPTVRTIIGGGGRYSAVDAFRATYRLQELKRAAEAEWKKMDVLLLPTTGTIYSRADVEADPIGSNTNLGYYTNFVNLLDLCAVAVPAGFRQNGLPFGVTMLAPAFHDAALLRLASVFHHSQRLPVGATNLNITELPEAGASSLSTGCVELAVVGAHLQGQPLNHQLTARGASLRSVSKTAPEYRLFALAGTVPAKPGLVREPGFAGPGIEVEVWSLPESEFGGFVAAIPEPLTIGTVKLHDGSHVKCFLCEPHAAAAGTEITELGGWRAFLSQQSR
ncbi:MAG TPA: allophanate hydrolase [Bryobacteraceae bacterium]|nr:allophanate hydrolase [Bryobacterales bacterium]HRJ18013.1 allophanate hydrolase [Bryobacteraceae bacterium]